MEKKNAIKINLHAFLILSLAYKVASSSENISTSTSTFMPEIDEAPTRTPQEEDGLKIFQTFKKWVGAYTYDEKQFLCFMNVTSIGKSGSVYFNMSLADNLITLDGNVYTSLTEPSPNTMLLGAIFPEKKVTLEMIRQLSIGTQLKNIKDFELAGFLSPRSGYDGWTLTASVFVPENNSFGQFQIHADNGRIKSKDATSSSNSRQVGITIGIIIPLAILGTIGFVFIIHWALRRGYIRHVPDSYGSLENLDEKSPKYNAGNGSVYI